MKLFLAAAILAFALMGGSDAQTAETDIAYFASLAPPSGMNVSEQSVECTTEYQVADNGMVLSVKNCGFNRTCRDDQTCCTLGVDYSCCDAKTEICNSGICYRRPNR
jgi:hypothetical protein